MSENENNFEKNTVAVFLTNNKFLYEIENLIRLFFPLHKIKFYEYTNFGGDLSNFICITIDKSKINNIILTVDVNLNGVKVTKNMLVKNFLSEDDICLQICQIIFEVLSSITKIHPKWGIITGIRPVKLFRSLLDSRGIEYAEEYFKNKLLVSEKKIKLAEEVNLYENNVINDSDINSFSLYVSIPFCPSKCIYCSFVSQSVEKSIKLIPVYLDLLIKELKYTAAMAKSLNLKLETIYIGGGTPTVLNSLQLENLISTIFESFDTDNCREFTVEAGRPDTLDSEKINVFSKFKDIRISINPQTFNDNVLKIIGRKHTSYDTIKAFEMARSAGLHSINMDLIAGLPEDSYESFCDTIDKTIHLSPDFVTLHTLAIKRAANILEKNSINVNKNDLIVEKMLDKAYSALFNSGYHPYYLYRQSKMIGNMENTGWAKAGLNGLYNIYIMDETHSILACGAGAVTKLKNPFNFNIKRIFNFKYDYEYISRFNEIIERKGQVRNFYEEFQ